MKFFKVALLILPLLTTGCSATVHLQPAEQSNAVSCAEIEVRLPDSVDGLKRRSTDAQSTAAWGEPEAVVLRCGLPEVSISALKCITENEVDWLVDDSKTPTYRFITFGRKPATEVIIDSKRAVGVNVIDAISDVIQLQPVFAKCG